ncbi:hypothetical protein AU490_13745 [Lonsdalea populi]|nr:hypothetical protein AU486_04565 [Lonsdalea quercina]RAT26537.1 hypothetical protein AU490_13745 [Lonsdalea populi]RAT36281.1 hypothetical protein AU491_06880 [Lonsdalea populi]RAT46941.1 hypothetical protein AU496_07575 [Lonsdalea populi]RAT53301.1 hypothetical protein AU498_06835 [Lonsdalea populi]
MPYQVSGMFLPVKIIQSTLNTEMEYLNLIVHNGLYQKRKKLIFFADQFQNHSNARKITIGGLSLMRPTKN